MDPYMSALYILPPIYEVTGHPPTSIIDIGCGDGEWLAAAKRINPMVNLLGIDNKPIIPPMLDPMHYIKMDIVEDPIVSTVLIEPYDLCLCLEVAEHLQPEHAYGLVRMLCQLSDYVLFSAAHPGQGPLHEDHPDQPDHQGFHHNEQLPGYWHMMFDVEGFDHIRLRQVPGIDPHLKYVDPWYRENGTLYYKNKVMT